MNIAIVGGGISGLYAAHCILKKHPRWKVSIYESSGYWGGRVRTVKYDGEVMDTGAGRFNENHKLLISLIKELGLEKDIYKLNTEKQYVKDGKSIKFHTLNYINMAIEKSMVVPVKHLKSVTLEMFMREFLRDSIVSDVISAFGYITEFESMNAYEAIKLFKGDFVQGVDYFILRGGLSKIVLGLVDLLKKKGCQMHLRTPVSGCSGHGNVLHFNAKSIAFDHVYYCLPKTALLNIKGLVENDRALYRSLETLGSAPLYRIYAKFPIDSMKGNVWFDGMPKVTTNGMLRTLIPLNPKTGFIMISYTDGRAAEGWHDVSGNELKENIMIHLRKMFPGKEIPDPLWVKGYFWKEGIHYWKPNAIIYKNKFSNGYSICGEVLCGHGWIEGALKSVNKLCSS